MPTATAEEVVSPKTEAAVTAKTPEPSFSDFLDQALSTNESQATAQAPTPVAEAPKPEAPAAPSTKTETVKSEPVKSTEEVASKTPGSILDQLGKIGVEEKKEATAKEAETENKIETEKLPENTPPAAQTAFAKLTKELREAKAKLKDFESKIADRTEAVEKKGGDVEADIQLKSLQAKLEQFQKERDELEGELRFSRLEATREYKATVGEPIKSATQAIADLAKAYEMKPNAILDTVSESDGAKRRAMLKELTGDMDAADALAVRMKVDELVQLNARREAMVKDSQATLQALEKAEEEQERSERAKYDAEAKKAFGEVWNDFQEQLPILKKIEGNDGWNKTIDELRTQAEKLDAEPLDHRQRAALTYQAVSLPLMIQVFKDYVAKTNQELTSLRSDLSEYRKATPAAGGGQAPEKTEKLDPGVSFLDAIEKG